MKKIYYISVFLLILCSYKTSGAFILSGDRILTFMVEKYGDAKSLFVNQTITSYDDAQTIKNNYREILRYLFPDKFRSDVEFENGYKINVVNEGTSFIMENNDIYKNEETKFDIYKEILLYRSIPYLTEKLHKLGIDLSVTSFGRYEDKICFVIGAEYPEATYPQLSIDKETFLPLELKALFNNKIIEIKYYDWHNFNNILYPSVINIYENKLLKQSIKVNDAASDVIFPETDFDIESIYAAKSGAILKNNND